MSRKKPTPPTPSEEEMIEHVGGLIDRVRWLMVNNYPRPPEWEQPIVAAKMKAAMGGDDIALAWLKHRFPPPIDGAEP